ncbi:hypothetical protein BCR39DRAFT_543946 [Naematelia encephala]|uniref:N-acetyltransferase domain-containing protein n=1 Tax=Naematelia encephala TaxID=71784 RepID=A0A1Y2ASL5_9TREE|nr:hypothetical protein BCR39DRAFT_543946 [Naematelia encephala]
MLNEPRIRPFRSGDEPYLSHISCCTGDSSKDGTGLLLDDEIWGEIWVLPYVARHPDLAWVVEMPLAPGDKQPDVVGFVVATPDTESFNEWFAQTWWPVHGARFPRPPSGSDDPRVSRTYATLAMADAVGRKEPNPYDCTANYPAHLHINILPVAQGHGLGRQLISTVLQALRDRGLKGVHLGTSAKNEGACAFYKRVGFQEAPAKEPGRTFVWDLSAPM